MTTKNINQENQKGLSNQEHQSEVDSQGAVETKEIVIDPNEKDTTTEVSNQKKSFRLTEKNKNLSDLLEREANLGSGNEFYGQLLKAFVEVGDREGLVYQEDYRVQLLDNLTRVVEIFDQIERRNTNKRDIYMSRAREQIDSLTEQVEDFNREKDELIQKHQEKVKELTDTHVVEIAKLTLDLKDSESKSSKYETSINELKEELKSVKATLEKTKEKLEEANAKKEEAVNSSADKDTTINTLSQENNALTNKAITQLEEIGTLKSENTELRTKVANLEDKLQNNLKYQEQRAALYEQQIETYKDLLSK